MSNRRCIHDLAGVVAITAALARVAKRCFLAGLLTTVAIAIAVAGCGTGSRDRTIVRVGTRSITEATLRRWIAILAPEPTPPDPPHYEACMSHRQAFSQASLEAALREECEQQYDALRRQALDFLISSAWLIGEAEDRGLKVSGREVDARVAEAKRAQAPAAATDRDLEFEATAELAAAKLQRGPLARYPMITRAQALNYYRRHLREFERPEERSIYIVENFKTAKSAIHAMSSGTLQRNLGKIGVHELVARSGPHSVGTRPRAMRAIFAAKPHVLSGPVAEFSHFWVFEVTGVTPAKRRPFASVAQSIERHLASDRRRVTRARFVASWRRRWSARTTCEPGYIVQKCREYSGRRTPEDSLALR